MKIKRLIALLSSTICALTVASCNGNTSVSNDDKATISVVNGTGSGIYSIGEEATIYATIPDGKDFQEWQVNESFVSSNNPYTFTVTQSETYTAIFKDHEADTSTYTVTVVNGTGGGEYQAGTQVTITATVTEGMQFKEWQVNGNAVSYANPYTITVTRNITYTAIFETQKYSLIVVNGEGSGSYEMDSEVTVTAPKKSGYMFVEWQIDGEKVSTANPYTFTLTGDTTITAVYTEVDPLYDYTNFVLKQSDKDFKILNLTDIQLHDGENAQFACDVIDELVAKEQPDMIVFLGDLLNDNQTYKSVVNYKTIINKIDSYDIPWAPIFGNHDYEDYNTEYASQKTTTSEDLITMYEAAENCLFIRGPEGVSGKSNYIVHVIDEDSGDIVNALYFMDSRLGGLDDTNAAFYEECVKYTTKSAGKTIPSVLFTHIAIKQYGDAFTASQACEYRDVTGSINRNPCDLASGTDLLFPKIKQYDSTHLVVCGHDHENAYYTTYDGVKLAYSMKSSQGDKYDNYPQLGGSVVTLGENDPDIYYTKSSKAFSLTNDWSVKPDTLGYWRYSGAKFVFDVELPTSGKTKFNFEGTNILRTSVEEDKRLGAWNRLTANVVLDASDKTIDENATLTQIEGNKYKVTVDLATVGLNTGSGEVACGDETIRIVYFHSTTGEFKISNVHFEYENVTETNQVDLADANISAVADQYYKEGLYIKPEVTVTLGGKTLKPVDDILVTYSNNANIGTATITVKPSGKGAHYYKGSKSMAFNIVLNEDADTLPGHENAILIDGNTTLEKAQFVTLNDWYNSGLFLCFDVKMLKNYTNKSGYTARFALNGQNANPGSPLGGSSWWNRLTANYLIDFQSHTIHLSGETTSIGTFVETLDNWWHVEIPFSSFVLNSAEQALGNANETLGLCYFDNITRSFKIDNIVAK